MANLDPAVARARFAQWVGRSLRTAKSRNKELTDREIAKRSGVGTTTFHRWKNGEGKDMPDIAKVKAFAAALDASFDEALAALGMSSAPVGPTPEGPLPQYVQMIMRKLMDPSTSPAERDFIERSLQMLADTVAPGPADKVIGTDAS